MNTDEIRKDIELRQDIKKYIDCELSKAHPIIADLRDHFAFEAFKVLTNTQLTPEKIAEFAYSRADCMMEARKMKK